MFLGRAGRPVIFPIVALALAACTSVPDGGGTVTFRTEWFESEQNNEFVETLAAAPSGDLVTSSYSFNADGTTVGHLRKRFDGSERWHLSTSGYAVSRLAVVADDAIYVLAQLFGPEAGPVFGANVSVSAFPANVLVKLGGAGEVLWSKVFDEGRAAYPTAFAADERGVHLGGTYATTFTLGDAVLAPSAVTGAAAFLAHVDPDGNVVSARSYGSNLNNGSISALVPNPDGTTLVAGFFGGTLSFGGTPMASSSSAIFFAKLDGSGNAMWAHHYVGFGQLSLARWADDYALMISGGPTDLGRGAWFSGRALARLGADGVVRWVKALDGETYGYTDERDVTTTASGHALLARVVPDAPPSPTDYDPRGFSRVLLAFNGSGTQAGALDLGHVEPGEFARGTRLAATPQDDVYASTSSEFYGESGSTRRATLRRIALDVTYGH